MAGGVRVPLSRRAWRRRPLLRIHVAKLAGLPGAVLARANEVLTELEKADGRPKPSDLADDLPLFSAAKGASAPAAPRGGDRAIGSPDFNHRAGKHSIGDRALEDRTDARQRCAARHAACALAGDSARAMTATAQVVDAPISTYHVKAIGVAHQTTVITIRPAIMPANASRSRTDGASVPSRNAPSTGPDANDSTARPASSTERFMNCAPSATRELHDAPRHRGLLRDAHLRGLIGRRVDVGQVEIADRRRRHRVERRRQRRGDDGRDDEAGEAVGQLADDEDRQDLDRCRVSGCGSGVCW